jgi:hypothetical protein
MLPFWNDASIGFPEVPLTITLTIRLWDAFPQLPATLFAAVADEIRHDLASRAPERNPNPAFPGFLQDE